jgi:glycerate kinase
VHVLIACDGFWDALNAKEVCHAIAKGLTRTHPDLVVVEMPLSDGGGDILGVLRNALALRTVTLEVRGPRDRLVQASYGLSGDGQTALVELESASGLELLTEAERDPLLTSTWGTGQLLADALSRGARTALLATGGSAANDAGTGMAAALGWQFLDATGAPVKPNGGNLQRIARMVPPPRGLFDKVEVLCDVTHRLYGPEGAAWVDGPRQGGNQESLTQLDAGLRHVAALVADQLGKPLPAHAAGAGVDGGVGFGAMAFLKARLKCSVEMALDRTGFDAAVQRADLVVISEGRLDSQSLRGHLVRGICLRAGTYSLTRKVPVMALCGELSATQEEVRAAGLTAAYCIDGMQRPLTRMPAATAENLEATAAALPIAADIRDTDRYWAMLALSYLRALKASGYFSKTHTNNDGVWLPEHPACRLGGPFDQVLRHLQVQGYVTISSVPIEELKRKNVHPRDWFDYWWFVLTAAGEQVAGGGGEDKNSNVQ